MLTLVVTAAAIWVSVEILNEVTKLAEFNQLRLKKNCDAIEEVTEDGIDWLIDWLSAGLHMLYAIQETFSIFNSIDWSYSIEEG